MQRSNNFSLWTRRFFLLASLVVFGPNLVSRCLAPFRIISIHESKRTASHPAPPNSIRVACYNIAHGRGTVLSNHKGGDRTTRKQRLDQIAQQLLDINADVVVLNEVDFDSSWSYGVNQAEYLAEKAGYAYRAEQRNLDFRVVHRTWRFGNAILSKYPIESAQVIDLPEFETYETWLAGKKRGIRGVINLGEIKLQVLGVHLSHRSESVRVASARLMNSTLNANPLPTIAMGDFNSTLIGFPNSQTDESGNNAMEVLKSGQWRMRPESPPASDDELTFHSTDPKSVIDWILISDTVEFRDYQVVASELSDHRMVYADVVIP
ncbi:MAG: endonuclease/exonuclease/phosphatase family protein [Planctomycetota bacterium]